MENSKQHENVIKINIGQFLLCENAARKRAGWENWTTRKRGGNISFSNLFPDVIEEIYEFFLQEHDMENSKQHENVIKINIGQFLLCENAARKRAGCERTGLPVGEGSDIFRFQP